MTQFTHALKRLHPWQICLLLTLLTLLIRLPNWRTLPAAGDEMGQIVHAALIANGNQFPLVGNDEYAGPFFFYLLAGLLKLGVTDAFVGRAVMLVAGTLTVPLTYLWANALSTDRRIALGTALLIAFNPHLILLNSHLGGTTYLMPFFSILFLWLLTVGVLQKKLAWLIGSGIAAGLALQANPVAGLLIAGGFVWALTQLDRRHWGQPIMAGVVTLLVYSPVIIHNLRGLGSVTVAQERSYLWVDEPSVSLTITNFNRLIQQLLRQANGVVIGLEEWSSLIGWVSIGAVGVVVGLFWAARKISSQPLWILLPFLIVLPIFSTHYGSLYPVRFTSLLTPALLFGLSACLISSFDTLSTQVAKGSVVIAALIVAAVPLTSLREYYQIRTPDRNGAALLQKFCETLVADEALGAVYLSDTLEASTDLPGMRYVPRACLVASDLFHAELPTVQMIGQLYANPQRSVLFVSDAEVETLQSIVPLTAWQPRLSAEFVGHGVQLLMYDGVAPLPQPDAVVGDEVDLTGLNSAEQGQILANALHLQGFDCQRDNDQWHINLYWDVLDKLHPATYMSFVHLYDPDSQAMLAQSDHLAGGEQFPLIAWQAGTTVRDEFILQVSETSSTLALRTGVYRWPEIERVPVVDMPENVIVLTESAEIICQ